MKQYILAAALSLSALGLGTASNAAVVMVDSRSSTATTPISLANGSYFIDVSGRVLIAGGSAAGRGAPGNDREADGNFFQRSVGSGFFNETADGFDVGLQINGSLSPWNGVLFDPSSVYRLVYTVTTGQISFLFRDRPNSYGDNFGSLRVEISPVPLPASALGLLAGLAGLAFLRRRKSA